MNGFSSNTVEFLQGLRTNNNHEWFNSNRASYDKYVRDATQQFCDSVAYKLRLETGQDHSFKIFRIHRDLRFSKDKTPYNTHIHMAFTTECQDENVPAWMIGLEPDKLTFGAGVMKPSTKWLAAWRAHIASAAGRELSDALSELIKRGCRMPKPELKRIPPGFKKDHPHGELLRRKSLTVWLDAQDTQICYGTDGPANCMAQLMTFLPVVNWLHQLNLETRE